jgi:preprotein translocase subunit SecB
MTDETTPPPVANGADAQEVPSQAPAIRVLAQYIKDFSFENPNAPASLREGSQPKIDLQLDVNARAMDEEGIFEVDLKINAKSERDGQAQFIIELVYSGLFGFSNIPADAIEPLLLAECPRLLFPFASIDRNQQPSRWFPATYARSHGLWCLVCVSTGCANGFSFGSCSISDPIVVIPDKRCADRGSHWGMRPKPAGSPLFVTLRFTVAGMIPFVEQRHVIGWFFCGPLRALLAL